MQHLGLAQPLFVNVGERDLADAIREYTCEVGVDVAFECAGHATSVRGCLESLRPMGHYTQVGICGREIEFPIDQVFYNAGSICYTAKNLGSMMKIYAQGRIRLSDLVSAKLPMSDWRTAFNLCTEKKP
ncbi:MAG: zinc-binding dehydrogenase [Bryobacteraceae bacterium]